MPGENVARIVLRRPRREEEVDVSKLHVVIAFGLVQLAQRDVEVPIHWPDRKTGEYQEEIAGESPEQLEARLKSLLDAGDTNSLLHAKGLANTLLRTGAHSALATQALNFVQSHAVWTPEGVERIASHEQMWQEVLSLENTGWFAELDQLATNLAAAKTRMPDGRPRLQTFYDVADNSHESDISPQVWASMDGYLKAWIKARPDSSTARILTIRMLRSQAWQIRGKGYASTVSPEQWAGFHRKVDEAIAYAESCEALCSADPEWYATTIALYIDHSTTDERIGPRFVEGRKKFPDYPYIYLKAARRFTPRWGGSPAMLERFAQQLIAQYPVRQRDEVYATLYSRIASYGSTFHEPPVSAWHVDCARWLRGLKTMTSEYPTLANISRAAYISAQCGDRTATRTYLRQVEGQPEMHEWGLEPESAAREYARVQAWAK
jgi:hypothetical protein